MTTSVLEQLRRWPDLEAPELVAVDAADRLLISELGQAVRADPTLFESELVVIGDNYGALTLGAISEFGFSNVRVHQDALSGVLALANNAKLTGISDFTDYEIEPALVAGARIVVMRLPRALEQLDQWCAMIAAHADEDVHVLAGGRIKHMSLGMNDVMRRYFGSVVASLAVQKSRVLRAKKPLAQPATEALSQWPKRKRYDNIDMTVCAEGGVFSSINLDIGTRELLGVLDQTPADAQHIIDLGCGTGILAVAMAKHRPSAHVIASDQSAAAVASARETVAANELDQRITVVRDDALSTQPDASADLIVFNPPFHSGAAVHADTSVRLFEDAGRVLRPGGELWVVANRHLDYRAVLDRAVGETRLVSSSPKFTVTATTKRS